MGRISASRRKPGPFLESCGRSGRRNDAAGHTIDEEVGLWPSYRDAQTLARACGRHDDPRVLDLRAAICEMAIEHDVDRAGAVVCDVQHCQPMLGWDRLERW